MKTGTVAKSLRRRQFVAALLGLTLGVALLVSCTTRPPEPAAGAPACPPPPECPQAAPCPACPVCPVCPTVAPPVEPPAKPLQPARWEDLPGWRDDDAAAALAPFLQSCTALGRKPEWRAVCADAAKLPPRAAPVREFFEKRFQVYEVVNADRSRTGLVTGYYEPLLKGSRRPSRAFPHAVFGVPDDLLVVDLGELYPELKPMRLRGRIEGRKVVPYYSRADLSAREPELAAKALYWVSDPIDLFFLQIQGSGRIELEDGSRVRVGYADQNGHPYRSIGRWLADKGELSLDQTSMEGIRNWALANPKRLAELLNANPSYVFFKELPPAEGGPPGALGVPLTPGRSIAVDPRSVPLGAPVFLSTTQATSGAPINRLMFAQDTGGAIRGAVRADFFWGFGAAAGTEAGRMKSSGRMWVLLPPEAAPK